MVARPSADWKQSGLSRLVNTSESWLQEVLLNARQGEFFAKYFLKDTYSGPFTPQRIEHFKLLDDDTIPYTYCCAYRGFGKTTNSITTLVKNACYRRFPFVVIASKTLDYAEENVSELAKQEILTNPLIRDVFGAMKPADYQGTSPSFSRKAWFLCDPKTGEPICLHVPKGQGQQVNGLIHRIRGRVYRVTLILLEDAEDRKQVDNEVLRSEFEDWVFGALFPCVSDARPDPNTNRWPRKNRPDWLPPWRVIYQDTIKHEASLMNRIPQFPEWKGAIFPKCEQREDGDFYSLVPDIVTDAQVREEAKQAQARGTMDRFAMEWMCKAQASDSDGWTRDLFQYYQDDAWRLDERADIDKFLVVDPARTNKARSAFSAMLLVAADCEMQRFYFRGLMHKRMAVEDVAVNAIKFAIGRKTRIIAVETTGGDDLWINAFLNAACALGVDGYVEFIWLDARQAPKGGAYETGDEGVKAARSSMLLPYYRLGQVVHDESLRNSPLENQELSWPKPSRWDALDCASYAPIVMQRLGKFWRPGKASNDKEFQALLDEARGTKKYREVSRRIRSGEWRAMN